MKKKKKKKAAPKQSQNLSVNKLLFWTALISLAVCLFIREYPAFFSFESREYHVSYQGIKRNVVLKQLDYQRDWRNAPEKHTVLQNMARTYISNTLTDSIFGYWYGTYWDFNGVTQEPRKGYIACGYFVTTTLQHCGFKLQRRKLAQQAASIIIKTLCDNSSIKTFNKIGLLKKHMDRQENGLYILGLDTHVGFLLKSEEGLHIIHSSYSANRQVSREKWNESVVMSKSKIFMVGNMTGNRDLLTQWIKGEQIIMIKKLKD